MPQRRTALPDADRPRDTQDYLRSAVSDPRVGFPNARSAPAPINDGSEALINSLIHSFDGIKRAVQQDAERELAKKERRQDEAYELRIRAEAERVATMTPDERAQHMAGLGPMTEDPRFGLFVSAKEGSIAARRAMGDLAVQMESDPSLLDQDPGQFEKMLEDNRAAAVAGRGDDVVFMSEYDQIFVQERDNFRRQHARARDTALKVRGVEALKTELSSALEAAQNPKTNMVDVIAHVQLAVKEAEFGGIGIDVQRNAIGEVVSALTAEGHFTAAEAIMKNVVIDGVGPAGADPTMQQRFAEAKERAVDRAYARETRAITLGNHYRAEQSRKLMAGLVQDVAQGKGADPARVQALAAVDPSAAQSVLNWEYSMASRPEPGIDTPQTKRNVLEIQTLALSPDVKASEVLDYSRFVAENAPQFGTEAPALQQLLNSRRDALLRDDAASFTPLTSTTEWGSIEKTLATEAKAYEWVLPGASDFFDDSNQSAEAWVNRLRVEVDRRVESLPFAERNDPEKRNQILKDVRDMGLNELETRKRIAKEQDGAAAMDAKAPLSFTPFVSPEVSTIMPYIEMVVALDDVDEDTVNKAITELQAIRAAGGITALDPKTTLTVQKLRKTFDQALPYGVAPPRDKVVWAALSQALAMKMKRPKASQETNGQ